MLASVPELGAVCVVCGDDMFASVGDRMYCLKHDPDPLAERIRRMEQRRAGKQVSVLEDLLDILMDDE